MFNIIKGNLFLWFLLFLLIVSPSLFFGAMGVIICIILFFILALVAGGLYLRWKILSAQRNGGFSGGFTGGFNDASQGRSQGSGTRSNQNGSNPRVRVVITDEESSATDKKVSDKVGDYVDFEEIKK